MLESAVKKDSHKSNFLVKIPVQKIVTFDSLKFSHEMICLMGFKKYFLAPKLITQTPQPATQQSELKFVKMCNLQNLPERLNSIFFLIFFKWSDPGAQRGLRNEEKISKTLIFTFEVLSRTIFPLCYRQITYITIRLIYRRYLKSQRDGQNPKNVPTQVFSRLQVRFQRNSIFFGDSKF